MQSETKTEADINEAKEKRNQYKNEIRKCKREHWVDMCNNANDISPLSRLNQLLKGSKYHDIGMMKKADNTYSKTPEEAVQVLADHHFKSATNEFTYNKESFNQSDFCNKYLTKSRIKQAINSFRPYRSPGLDGIYPCMLIEHP